MVFCLYEHRSQQFTCSKLSTFRCLHQRCKTNTIFHVAPTILCNTRKIALPDPQPLFGRPESFFGGPTTVCWMTCNHSVAGPATIFWNICNHSLEPCKNLLRPCNHVLKNLQQFVGRLAICLPPKCIFQKKQNKTVK